MNNYYETLDFNKAFDIGNNVIAIQQWYYAYGHFMDENFNLFDFHSQIKKIYNLDFKILNDYSNDVAYKNYPFISNVLFGNNHINSFHYDKKILKFKNLFLIKHKITMPTFHKFPLTAKNHILNFIQNNNSSNNDKIGCFITRGIATHLPRNLDNQNEIEDFFNSKQNFCVINPEKITICDFINTIQNKNIIVITWGSALVNLLFLKPQTNVIILKSKSYEHESIELFKHIIKDLNLHILVHENNMIHIESIENTLSKILY
jgi:capsular polysaccharide biosynthesis protein